MKKIAVVAVALMLVCLMLAGCAQAQAKTFEKAGMSITLTDQFVEKEMAAYTAYYESADVLVIALKEEFTLFEQAGLDIEMSLLDYGDIIMAGNGLDSTVKETDGVTYFTYEQEVTGREFTYFASLFRGTDAYWMVQFACESKNYESSEAQFVSWAKTVEV